jgi:hypothetical protein
MARPDKVQRGHDGNEDEGTSERVRLPDGGSTDGGQRAELVGPEEPAVSMGWLHGPNGSGDHPNGTLDPAAIADRLLNTAVRDWGHPDDPIRQAWPTLAGFLFKKSWNGFTPRECALLTIGITPTGVSFTLKMPSEANSVQDVVSHVDQVFERLERCLQTGEGNWKELKSGPGATFLREERKKLRDIRKSKK